MRGYVCMSEEACVLLVREHSSRCGSRGCAVGMTAYNRVPLPVY